MEEIHKKAPRDLANILYISNKLNGLWIPGLAVPFKKIRTFAKTLANNDGFAGKLALRRPCHAAPMRVR